MMSRLLMPIWMCACHPQHSFGDGNWRIESENVLGTVIGESANGCRSESVRIGLWGPQWGTRGLVDAEVQEESDGSHWLYFGVDTGLGPARLAMHWQGGLARLPMGGRPGEFELSLTITEGAIDAEASQAAQRKTQQTIEEAQDAWAEGHFLLFEEDRLVGDVQFAGSSPTTIAVYDSWWLTPSPVEAQRLDDGTDIVLAFAAEPTILGDSASLRFNVPTGQVVVPTGPVPVAGERRLEYRPGTISDAQRDEAVSAAIHENLVLEENGIIDLLSQLAATAYIGAGQCQSLDALSIETKGFLTGYSVEVAAVEGHCELHIEPTLTQHGRRFKGVVGPKGLVKGE